MKTKFLIPLLLSVILVFPQYALSASYADNSNSTTSNSTSSIVPVSTSNTTSTIPSPSSNTTSSSASSNTTSSTTSNVTNSSSNIVNTIHSTSIVVAPNTATINQQSHEKFTATVTDTSSSPTTLTGKVSWNDGNIGGTFSPSSCTLSSGSCSVSYEPPSNSPNNITITASYGSDDTHIASTAASSLSIIQLHSVDTVIVPSTVTTNQGSQETFTVTVTDTSSSPTIPTGIVTWTDGSAGGSFSSSSCTLVSGSCTTSYTPGTSTNSPNKIEITESYQGDSTHSGGTSTSTLIINQIHATTVSITPNSVAINQGSKVTLTARLTDASGSPISPIGTVSWSDGNIGGTFSTTSCILSSASCTVSYYPPANSPNNITITASYGGDDVHSTSTTTSTLAINQMHATTANISPNFDTVNSGSQVTFTATVTDTSSSPSIPIGTISWSDGNIGGTFSSTFCVLSSNSCTISYTLPVNSPGSVTISATFGGDSTHTSSTATSILSLNQSHATLSTANLVGEWNFENNILDTSGNNNNGATSGGVSFVQGKVGQAISFDGTGIDRVPVSSTLNFGVGSFSISTWIKTTQTSIGYIVEHRTNNDGVYAGYSLEGQNGPGNLIGRIRDSNGHEVFVSTGSINNNQFHHVVFVVDRSIQTSKMYVDGSLVSSANISSVGNIDQNSIGVDIGYTSSPNTPNGPFVGQVDQLRIYNRALSTSEIQNLFNEGGNTITTITNSTSTGTQLPTIVLPTFISLTTDQSYYAYGDVVTLSVNLSGQSLQNIAVGVSNPSGDNIISRTLTTDENGTGVLQFKIPDTYQTGIYQDVVTAFVNGKSYTNSTEFTVIKSHGISIDSVQITDQQGNPASMLKMGQNGFVKVSLSSGEQMPTLVTLNLFDANQNSLGTASVKSVVTPGKSNMTLSFFIPPTSKAGLANVFTDAYSDWPSNGGTSLTTESCLAADLQDPSTLPVSYVPVSPSNCAANPVTVQSPVMTNNQAQAILGVAIQNDSMTFMSPAEAHLLALSYTNGTANTKSNSVALVSFNLNDTNTTSSAGTGNVTKIGADQFTILVGPDLQNNPMALKILQEIQASKRQVANIIGNETAATLNEQLVLQQRQAAADQLKQALTTLAEKNASTTPDASFASFLTTVDNNKTQAVFQDEYNFMKQRVAAGNAAMHTVLNNGGSLEQALLTFNQYTKINHVQLVTLNNELNVAYGLADSRIQSCFNSNGQLTVINGINPCVANIENNSTGPNGISIVSVQPTDQQGNPVSLMTKGKTGYVKVVIDSSTSTQSLVTLNLFDSNISCLGTVSAQYTLSPGQSEVVVPYYVPTQSGSGLASIYANVFSDWPNKGGTSQSNEVSYFVGLE